MCGYVGTPRERGGHNIETVDVAKVAINELTICVYAYSPTISASLYKELVSITGARHVSICISQYLNLMYRAEALNMPISKLDLTCRSIGYIII